MNSGILTRLTNWAAHPFKTDMSVMGWVMFSGLIICAAILWSRVVSLIETE